jgi:hypothetical protein
MENENFSFSIGLDNRKALALFGCPVFSGHNSKNIAKRVQNRPKTFSHGVCKSSST